MKKRLASLFLLLMLAGSTIAGIPLHFGESNCSMDGMMDMDCCKAALMQTETPEVADAKLCCALNCAQNGSTLPMRSIRVTPPSLAHNASYPANQQLLPNSSVRFVRSDCVHGPPAAAPAYLRNLALLI